jgi:hypothetical protein
VNVAVVAQARQHVSMPALTPTDFAGSLDPDVFVTMHLQVCGDPGFQHRYEHPARFRAGNLVEQQRRCAPPRPRPPRLPLAQAEAGISVTRRQP